MKNFTIYFLFIFLSISYVYSEILYVNDASIKCVSENKYLIEVIGTAPTPGYTNIQIVPNAYLTPPVNWEMSVVGIPPTSEVEIQLIAPFFVTLEYTLPKETKEVTIKGRNRSIILLLEEDSSEELLYGIKETKESIIFLVLSNGCTTKDNFVCKVDSACKTPSLTLYRIKKDECKKVPEVIEIAFSKQELALDKVPAFTVKNKFYVECSSEKYTSNYLNLPIVTNYVTVAEMAINYVDSQGNSISGASPIENSKNVWVGPENLFLAKTTVATGCQFSKKPEGLLQDSDLNESFQFLKSFSYPEGIGAVHFCYLCRVRPQVNAKSFMFSVKGSDYGNKDLKADVRIQTQQNTPKLSIPLVELISHDTQQVKILRGSLFIIKLKEVVEAEIVKIEGNETEFENYGTFKYDEGVSAKFCNLGTVCLVKPTANSRSFYITLKVDDGNKISEYKLHILVARM